MAYTSSDLKNGVVASGFPAYVDSTTDNYGNPGFLNADDAGGYNDHLGELLATQGFVLGIFGPYTVNVRHHGAVGDGVTDDTDALEAAFDEISNGVGKNVIYFPAGRYKTTRLIHGYGEKGVLIGTAGTCGGGTTYQGYGAATSIENWSGGPALHLHGWGAVKDVTVWCETAEDEEGSYPSSGIIISSYDPARIAAHPEEAVNGGNDGFLDNVWIGGAGGTGFFGLKLDSVQGWHLNRVTIDTTQDGGWGLWVYGQGNHLAHNCRFFAAKGDAGRGVFLQGVISMQFSACLFDYNCGPFFTGSIGRTDACGGLYALNCGNISLSGCHVNYNSNGIVFDNVVSGAITGGAFSTNSRDTIILNNCKRITVTGNAFEMLDNAAYRDGANTGVHVRLKGTTQRCVIANNVMEHDDTNRLQAIVLEATTTKNRVDGNIGDGGFSGGFVTDGGTDNSIGTNVE